MNKERNEKAHDEDEVQKVSTEGVPKNPFNDNDQSAGTKNENEEAAAEQQRKEAMTEHD